jgi:hypothetical protein
MPKTYDSGREPSKLDEQGNGTYNAGYASSYRASYKTTNIHCLMISHLQCYIYHTILGFIYYPNGSVAVCVSEASSYQKRFFAFDSNRKNTSLLIIDEYGVGSCSATHRKQFRGENCDFSLSKSGGIINSSDGQITHQWKWDPNAQYAGTPPPAELSFQLNENITFKFNGVRTEMLLVFQCESFMIELDMGVKVRRTDSYLDHAHKGQAGRLIPQFEHTTLDDRQEKFAKEMAAARNKLNPRSENLSDMVCDIVSKLEVDFDDIKDSMKLSQGIGTAWKKEALNMTLGEIPRITNTGMETGITPGFSTTIYRGMDDILGSTVSRVVPYSVAYIIYHIHIRHLHISTH